jgi:tetratricopeptide (TPR) repeat protein
VSTARDRRIARSLNHLAAEGRHVEVLDHPMPSRANRQSARVLQAFSAVLTGRYAVALVLLGPPGARARGLADPAAEGLVRAVALVGLGRYAQAAALLGDRPDQPELRRLRAQVAIEVGEDSLAEELLRAPDGDLMGEAGRRRVLGQLRLRQGRRSEGEALVREARSLYAGLDHYGKDVDQAYCSLLLGRAALHDGRMDEAVPLVEEGLLGMRARPDHAPGLAEAHALAAEARAGAGESVAAEEHLRQAKEQALLCGSAALDAEVVRSAAMVALRLGDAGAAESRLREAVRLHETLGARPSAAELRAVLSSLGA